MPLVRVKLSADVNNQKAEELRAEISRIVATTLGKAESHMMVVLEPNTQMSLGGSNEPTAFVDVRAVGNISGEHATALSAALSQLMGQTGTAPDRVFCNFTGLSGSMWGIGDHTLG